MGVGEKGEEREDELNLSCSSNASCFLDCRMMRGCLMREWEVRARKGREEKGGKRERERERNQLSVSLSGCE